MFLIVYHFISDSMGLTVPCCTCSKQVVLAHAALFPSFSLTISIIIGCCMQYRQSADTRSSFFQLQIASLISSITLLIVTSCLPAGKERYGWVG